MGAIVTPGTRKRVARRGRVQGGRVFAVAGVCALAACSAGTGVMPGPVSVLSKMVPAATSGHQTGPEQGVQLASLPGNDAGVTAQGARVDTNSPYEVGGKVYFPETDPTYDRVGMASWYGGSFHGRRTANGEVFDRMDITAAHPTLPLPSYVRITNLDNDRSILVRVNDRGPFSAGRLVDVSEQTAELLAFHRDGSTKVRVQYVSAAPLGADDTAMLLASYKGPPPRRLVAFAGPDDLLAKPVAAVKAVENVSKPYSATDRILMAFDVAAEIEE